MVDKFKGLEGRITKEIEVLKSKPESLSEQFSRRAGMVDAYEQVLKWIRELNNMEVLEQRQMVF
jgi:hypothetical protein